MDQFADRPDSDSDWEEEDWLSLLEALVEDQVLNWKEVAALTIGHLNPSQVGTSIASKKEFQRHFQPRKCWAAVRQWHFLQEGQCVDCGTRLELQADHVVPKEIVGDVGERARETGATSADEILAELEKELTANGTLQETTRPLRRTIAEDLVELMESKEPEKPKLSMAADRLDNMVMRCRRCNVIRRPSHSKGGLTFLTTESGLMWLLLVKRPRTYEAFQDLCREYGMTMANIRFEEAWAMARWLHRIGKYDIDPSSKYAP